VRALAAKLGLPTSERYVAVARNSVKTSEVAELQGTNFVRVMDTDAVTKLNCLKVQKPVTEIK
jgi:hypothetical protein